MAINYTGKILAAYKKKQKQVAWKGGEVCILAGFQDSAPQTKAPKLPLTLSDSVIVLFEYILQLQQEALKLVLFSHLRLKREVMVVRSCHKSFLRQHEHLAFQLEDKI